MARLFVYGTLRSDATDSMGRAARERLQRQSSLVGPAMMPGVMYDLGRYPGVQQQDGDPDRHVQGEVLALRDPDTVFAWLDGYEGDEYDRVEREAVVAGAGTTIAWVYLLRITPAAPIIPSGIWQASQDDA